MRQVLVARCLERADVFKRGTANALRGDLGKEPFDLIQPTRARRREVEMVPRVAEEPSDHFRLFMGAGVVHDDVHFAGRGQLGVETREEFQELLVPVSSMALADDGPGRYIQRREQQRRPVTNVVVGLLRREARTHRQQGTGAIERLHLTLFIQAEH